MKIKGQTFELTPSYLVLRLNEPFWSAYQRFGWLEGTPGFSINDEAINKAMELKKKILVRNKYGDYEITPTRALRFGGRMNASNGTPLICVPKSAFKKLPAETDHDDSLGVMSKMVNTPQWEELRKKLHPNLKGGE